MLRTEHLPEIGKFRVFETGAVAGPRAVATRGAGWWMAVAAAVCKLPPSHPGKLKKKYRIFENSGFLIFGLMRFDEVILYYYKGALQQ